MKAAVLHHFGEIPRYEDFMEPVPSELPDSKYSGRARG